MIDSFDCVLFLFKQYGYVHWKKCARNALLLLTYLVNKTIDSQTNKICSSMRTITPS